jgi:hypothetical protein
MAPLSSSRSHGAHKNCARAEAAPALGRKLWSTGQTPPGPTVAARTGNRLSHRSMPPVLDSAVDAAGFARLSATASATHWSVLVVAGWSPTDVVHRLGDDVHAVAKTYGQQAVRQRSPILASSTSWATWNKVRNGWAMEDPKQPQKQCGCGSDQVPADSSIPPWRSTYLLG